jgi:hypothetical protein
MASTEPPSPRLKPKEDAIADSPPISSPLAISGAKSVLALYVRG